MNAAGMKVLERLFAAEVLDRLPFQSKAGMIKTLADDGYIQPMRVEHRDRFGVMVIEGWQLTHLGRLTYCASCEPPTKERASPQVPEVREARGNDHIASSPASDAPPPQGGLGK